MEQIATNYVINEALLQKLYLAESVINILVEDSIVYEKEIKRLKKQIEIMKKVSVN